MQLVARRKKKKQLKQHQYWRVVRAANIVPNNNIMCINDMYPIHFIAEDYARKREAFLELSVC